MLVAALLNQVARAKYPQQLDLLNCWRDDRARSDHLGMAPGGLAHDPDLEQAEPSADVAGTWAAGRPVPRSDVGVGNGDAEHLVVVQIVTESSDVVGHVEDALVDLGDHDNACFPDLVQLGVSVEADGVWVAGVYHEEVAVLADRAVGVVHSRTETTRRWRRDRVPDRDAITGGAVIPKVRHLKAVGVCRRIEHGVENGLQRRVLDLHPPKDGDVLGAPGSHAVQDQQRAVSCVTALTIVCSQGQDACNEVKRDWDALQDSLSESPYMLMLGRSPDCSRRRRYPQGGEGKGGKGKGLTVWSWSL